MVFALASKIFGSANDRAIKKLARHVEPINALEEKYKAMSDSDLQAQTQVFKSRLAEGATEDDIMHDAFAVVRETARRVLGERHYDVQLIGGVCLHQGALPR